MKVIPKILIVIAVFSLNTFGQKSELKINDIQTPVSPGFILMDQAPASVDIPTNPKALVLSLLNLKNGGAIEISPYWLIKKLTDELTFDAYIKNISPIAQTFSLSVATAKTDKDVTNVSAGFRFTPLRGYRKSLQQKVDSLIIELANLANLARITTLRNEIIAEKQKPAFIVQIAGATAGQSKTNSFDDFTGNKNGIWANAKWNATDNFGLTILGRIIKNKNNLLATDNASFADLGFSLNYEMNNFQLSGEGVFRKDNQLNSSSQRLVLVGNYRVKENIYIVGSFGKNFKKVDNIIALFGINIGLSKDTVGL
jgi:hypothetical protein